MGTDTTFSDAVQAIVLHHSKLYNHPQTAALTKTVRAHLEAGFGGRSGA